MEGPLSAATRDRLVFSDNPHIDVITNDLELGALLIPLHLFSLSMPPPTHVCTYVDNTAAQGWEH